jgi:hypothetical protein
MKIERGVTLTMQNMYGDNYPALHARSMRRGYVS